jgi:CheY-like chemotaxis protein
MFCSIVKKIEENTMKEKKILVVDDEELIRKVLQRAFGEEGYTVRTADDAIEALEILNNEEIEVMFLDLKMPGMNGVDLCRKIRKAFPKVCIFALTGYSSVFELGECREAGFDDYFTKPLDLKLISGAAKDAFEKLERWRNE